VAEMDKHFEKPSELQFLAKRLGEFYDEIKLIDDHGTLRETGDELEDKRIRKAADELWDQYRGIQEYMQFCFPVDAKCCLILAAALMSRLEEVKYNEMDWKTLDAATGEMNRLLQSLIAGLEDVTDCTLADLGLRAFFPENINDARRAVRVVREIQTKQYQNAKEAGIVDIVKADAKFEQEEAAGEEAAKPARKPTASQRAKPETEPAGE